MTNTTENQPVDRSRLKLLGILVAGSAAGGCNTGTPVDLAVGGNLEKNNPFSTLRNTQSKPKKVVPAPATGGEGGEGGGGSH